MSDIYAEPTLDGADVIIDRRGNPTMTGGLDNAVYLSVFVGPWWANRVEPAATQYISKVPEATRESLTLRAARAVAESTRSSLAWLLSFGAAQSVAVEPEITERDLLTLPVEVVEPDGTRRRLVYGLNWTAQRAQL